MDPSVIQSGVGANEIGYLAINFKSPHHKSRLSPPSPENNELRVHLHHQKRLGKTTQTNQQVIPLFLFPSERYIRHTASMILGLVSISA